MKEVGLACTGGGVRAAVNIGIIKGLEEEGIKINAISGASAGGYIAVLYAIGYSTAEISELFKESILKCTNFSAKDKLLSVHNFFSKAGLKNTNSIAHYAQDACFKKRNNAYV